MHIHVKIVRRQEEKKEEEAKGSRNSSSHLGKARQKQTDTHRVAQQIGIDRQTGERESYLLRDNWEETLE